MVCGPPSGRAPSVGPGTTDGTIIPDGPNRIWGTAATQVKTREEGVATVFVAIDPFVGDVVGIHAARPGARFEALEPFHQGIRDHYGPLAKDIAEGLVLRHDHDPQSMGHAFQQESVSRRAPASSGLPRATGSPSGSFARSRNSSCGCGPSIQWRNFGSPSWSSRRGSTGTGCCSETPAEVRAQYEPAKKA